MSGSSFHQRLRETFFEESNPAVSWASILVSRKADEARRLKRTIVR